MLVVDANVLVYAVNQSSAEHEVAREWLQEALNQTEAVALQWTVRLAFFRLTTHPAVFRRPLSVAEASAELAGWIEAPPVVPIEPTRRHVWAC